MDFYCHFEEVRLYKERSPSNGVPSPCLLRRSYGEVEAYAEGIKKERMSHV